MSALDFENIEKYYKIDKNALKLLMESEKEVKLHLNLRIDENTMIEAECFVVYYNTARGPAKGGIRFWDDVTIEETRDLAERMVYKTALTKIPFGGGKSGIRLNPGTISRFQKTAVMKEYVHLLKNDLIAGDYIPAPDMGTNPDDMAIIYGELHIPTVVTGKPPSVGGLPGRKQATGKGVSISAELSAKDILNKDIKGLKVAVQGFGNVGSWSAYFLNEMGAKVIAVSDIDGGIIDSEKGINVPELMQFVNNGKKLVDFGLKKISNKELLELEVDILVPAARENVITVENADKINAKLIVEGANGPTTLEADTILRREKKIPVVPDILANSGGVIASYVEWRQAKSGSITEETETYQIIRQQISKSFCEALQLSREKNISLRTACEIVAVSEVDRSMRDRGWY